MDIFIARQPIFNRDMSIFGYELLHSSGSVNKKNDDRSAATAELVHHSFLLMNFDHLTDGTRGFIHFNQDLLEVETPKILPREKVVIEIPETVSTTADRVVEICKRLKNEGFLLALDDLICSGLDSDYRELLALADIIRIDFPSIDKKKQRELLKKYGRRIPFLAENLETREEFREAEKMGYKLFQGYFFCKPTMIKSKEITSLNIHLIEILNELQKAQPSFGKITEVIEKDLGLTYKLLKMANSIHYGTKSKITNLNQAITRLGIDEMKRWISVMIIKGFETDENSELIKVSLLRGKLLSLIARELKRNAQGMDYFLTGVLSSIDIIMDQDMRVVLADLAISEDVRKALTGGKGKLRDCLDAVLFYERLDFDKAMANLAAMRIDLGRFTELYIDALAWQRTIGK